METKKIIVDVRERDEFKQQHIPNSINLPLSELKQSQAFHPLLEGKEVVLVCRSGNRAEMARASFESAGLTCEVYPEGIVGWQKQGKQIVSHGKTTMSIFRQVQLIVGFAVFGLSMAGYFVNHVYTLVAGVLGLALGLAGLFGFCMLAIVLAKMPWNKA